MYCDSPCVQKWIGCSEKSPPTSFQRFLNKARNFNEKFSVKLLFSYRIRAPLPNNIMWQNMAMIPANKRGQSVIFTHSKVRALRCGNEVFQLVSHRECSVTTSSFSRYTMFSTILSIGFRGKQLSALEFQDYSKLPG